MRQVYILEYLSNELKILWAIQHSIGRRIFAEHVRVSCCDLCTCVYVLEWNNQSVATRNILKILIRCNVLSHGLWGCVTRNVVSYALHWQLRVTKNCMSSDSRCGKWAMNLVRKLKIKWVLYAVPKLQHHDVQRWYSRWLYRSNSERKCEC